MAFDDDLVGKVSNQALPALQEALTKSMTESQWPEDVIKRVTVKYVAGTVVIDIPQNLHETVTSLEYGDFDSPPRPALRRFAPERDRIITEVLEASLPEYLTGFIERTL